MLLWVMVDKIRCHLEKNKYWYKYIMNIIREQLLCIDDDKHNNTVDQIELRWNKNQIKSIQHLKSIKFFITALFSNK